MRSSVVVKGAAVSMAALVAAALPAAAAQGQVPDAPAHFHVKTFAAVGAESKPDDVTRLGGSVYVTFQNGVGPLGEPAPSGVTSSTIQEFTLAGMPRRSWNVVGKVDGLTADPSRHRLLLTSNEDGNSSFSTLTPGQAHPLKTYTYAGLTHGGGTDAVTVFHGRILVSASHPADTTGPAAYDVALHGDTATLTAVFTDDAKAIAANGPQAGHTVSLALTDPDSNTVVPQASPRFKGAFLLDAQGDRQLIFASQPCSVKPKLHVLAVPQPLDDTVFAASAEQVLWVTDPTHNTVSRVSGPFTAGLAISTVAPDTGTAYLATLNLTDGSLSPIRGLAQIQPKGLIFTSPSDESTDPQ